MARSDFISGCLLFKNIGQVSKELFCVKKSILVTFSVLIISLCEVNSSVFIAKFFQIKCSICQDIPKMFIKKLHSIVAPLIFFNLMYEIRALAADQC